MKVQSDSFLVFHIVKADFNVIPGTPVAIKSMFNEVLSVW
jgi:hypothetical protein